MNDAAAFYESVTLGIGRVFLEELRRAILAACSNPSIGVSVGEGRRRFPFWRFPYSLIYFVEKEMIVVVAIAHQRRRPGYWK